MEKVFVQSNIPNGVRLNIDTSTLEFCNVVSMCIKEPNTESYQIPDQFVNVMDDVLFSLISSGMLGRDSNLDYDKYCYLTIKKMFVQPNSTGNREGFHIDGFLSDQRNFIWFDSLPTEICCGDFYLTPDHKESIEEMEAISKNHLHIISSTDVNTLYDLDQSVVHRPSINLTDKPVLRTFIKITYTKELFNAFGNAWNYKLPHIRPKKLRAEERNHGVL